MKTVFNLLESESNRALNVHTGYITFQMKRGNEEYPISNKAINDDYITEYIYYADYSSGKQKPWLLIMREFSEFQSEFYQLITKGKSTQLIFTTHESSIMSQDVFRRDEIWFVEKNEDNASTIYSLDKFSERYDRKIDKAYLDGRYGALPIFTQTECKGGEQ